MHDWFLAPKRKQVEAFRHTIQPHALTKDAGDMTDRFGNQYRAYTTVIPNYLLDISSEHPVDRVYVHFEPRTINRGKTYGFRIVAASIKYSYARCPNAQVVAKKRDTERARLATVGRLQVAYLKTLASLLE
jgi:hypothetical protein